jgi:MFS transporter, DHA1 family, inner membrane transport protein
MELDENRPELPRTIVALIVLFLATSVLSCVPAIANSVLLFAGGDPDTVGHDPGAMTRNGYLLGLVVGGPLLTAASLRLGRRAVLLLSMGASVPVTAGMALASGTVPLAVGAAAAGALYGMFFGAACVMAVSMVPSVWLGRAASVVLAGDAVAIMVSPLLGGWAEQVASARLALLAIAVAGLIVLPLLRVVLPRVATPAKERAAIGPAEEGKAIGPAEEGKAIGPAFAPRVLAVLGIAVLLLGAQSALISGLSLLDYLWGSLGYGQIVLFLAVAILVVVVALLAGGWAADRNAVRAMTISTVVMLLAPSTLFFGIGLPGVAVAALLVMELARQTLAPAVLHSLMTLAGPGRHLAAPLFLSAIGAGSAAGGELGIRTTDLGGSFEISILVAAAISLVAFSLVWTVKRTRRRLSEHEPPAHSAGL